MKYLGVVAMGIFLAAVAPRAVEVVDVGSSAVAYMAVCIYMDGDVTSAPRPTPGPGQGLLPAPTMATYVACSANLAADVMKYGGVR